MFIGHDLVKERMFKYLGHYLQDDFRTNRIVETLDKRITAWITIIDSSLLTGPMKAWILNHAVCAKISWMLMVHNFKLGQLDKWKVQFHRKFREWLGLAKSCESSILYRSREHFGLNLQCIREYSKRLKVSRMQLLKHSLDPGIRRLYTYLLQRDRKLRVITSSLRKFIPPKKRQSQLPPHLGVGKGSATGKIP